LKEFKMALYIRDVANLKTELEQEFGKELTVEQLWILARLIRTALFDAHAEATVFCTDFSNFSWRKRPQITVVNESLSDDEGEE